jgi:hypothetical protein
MKTILPICVTLVFLIIGCSKEQDPPTELTHLKCLSPDTVYRIVGTIQIFQGGQELSINSSGTPSMVKINRSVGLLTSDEYLNVKDSNFPYQWKSGKKYIISGKIYSFQKKDAIRTTIGQNEIMGKKDYDRGIEVLSVEEVK